MARPTKLTPEKIEELRCERAELDRLGVSARPWAEEMGRMLGVSPKTIYRQTAPKVRSRRRRSDAGTMKAIEAEAFADIAALVLKHGYTPEHALENVNHLRKKEGKQIYEVSPATLRSQLRDLGLGRRTIDVDRRVHRRWEGPYAGFLFQMDSTVAPSYYIDVDDTIGYESPVLRNKSKAGNGRPRLWLLCIVDDFSRVKWARYYTGNNASVWIDMITRAMRKGAFADPDIWPAFGVPEKLYTDQDAAMKARESVDFLAAFEIERMLALPSTEHFTNAQAKGKAEKAIGDILRGFEVVTRASRFQSLEQMNQVLTQYLIHINNRPHGTTGVGPFERWITAPQIRVLPEPEIVRRLSARSETCSVTPDLAIRLEGKVFQLPRREPFIDYVKERVDVRYFRADLSKITVILDGQAHEIDAVEAVPDVAGEFKEAPVPMAVALKRELLERDTAKYDSVAHEVFAARVEADPRSYPIRPLEVEHPAARAAYAETMVRKGRAMDRLRHARLMATPPTPAELAAFHALMAGRDEIPEAELRQWIDHQRQQEADAAGRPTLRIERA